MISLFRLFSFFLLIGSANATDDLLPPEKAFQAYMVQIDDHTLEVRFKVAPGYYLYRDRISFKANPQLTPDFPIGAEKNDPSFGKVHVYKYDTAVRLKSTAPVPLDMAISAKFQGCAEVGVCYPPQTQQLKIGDEPKDALEQLFGKNNTPVAIGPSGADVFFSGGFLTTLGIFFLAGLGLALTSCMYPLIPIVSGIVLGNGQQGKMRALGLTFTYVQGLALSYTLIGIAAAATGTLLVVTLQQPFVIAIFSMFFVFMALAMFGLFDLQLSGGIQSKMNQWANLLPGGQFTSVFAMGALSALIVGPCIVPPLAAALAYLGQTGDLLLGGSALYMLALGLGLPLLAIGVFGGSVLPKLSGKFMQGIRIVFGVLLLVMAVWVARPLWEKTSETTGPQFAAISSVAELDRSIANANGQIVVLDFYADWCIACKEFERDTLSDPEIQATLSKMVLLRADVTQNNPADQALLKRFKLFGPPAILFTGNQGQFLNERVIGYQDPAAFKATLNRVKKEAQ
ncbi:protein-disulfide reductase DsbD [Iodobacter fluviatilis]|uniref:Thiol:disulfide interchange protein n=1 Tax=Iodobacter fluviatilis TaxID=537 RepID=A0A7G3G6Q1_9NEIS|nr:protein-disulfide reductase DsbD [Iodobacter fluviatilis]QBC42977.1 thiol:disulfide interchange protein [Iodobacter fluviatilis]